MLISDPIDGGSSARSSIEERLAYNETFSELPTLIQCLKSEFVIDPVSKELGISSGALRSRISIALDGLNPIFQEVF